MAGKKFSIQTNPTFKAVVKIPRVGGDPLDVSFTFKALGRRELAKLFDSWKTQHVDLVQEAQDAAEEGNQWTLEQWADHEIPLQVSQVKDIVVAWSFDDEFNDENIEALVSTAVSVTDAIIEQYNDAYSRAKSGN